MIDIYVGVFIQRGLIDYVTAGTNKESVIQEMKDIIKDSDFDEDMDQAVVFLNNICIWSYAV